MNEWLVGACFVILLLTVYLTVRQLVRVNECVIRWANRWCDHAHGFNEDQREFMRNRFEAESGREPLDTGHPHAGHDRGVPMPPNSGEPFITAPIPYEG